MQIVEIMEKTFEAESGDTALYLAMSKKAADEGHSDIALYLYNVAMEEASHAAEFAILLGKVKDTRLNVSMMLEDEIRSEKERALQNCRKRLNQIPTMLPWENKYGTKENNRKYRR